VLLLLEIIHELRPNRLFVNWKEGDKIVPNSGPLCHCLVTLAWFEELISTGKKFKTNIGRFIFGEFWVFFKFLLLSFIIKFVHLYFLWENRFDKIIWKWENCPGFSFPLQVIWTARESSGIRECFKSLFLCVLGNSGVAPFEQPGRQSLKRYPRPQKHLELLWCPQISEENSHGDHQPTTVTTIPIFPFHI
jgi:hypothetical protein